MSAHAILLVAAFVFMVVSFVGAAIESRGEAEG
jgi:hypothetical protein